MNHYWIAATGTTSVEGALRALELPPALARIDANRRLRGPYTAAGSLVRQLAARFGPDRFARHDIEVLTVAPELRGRVPNERRNLTWMASPEERTRYYPPSYTRRLAHGLTELLLELLPPGERASLLVDGVEHADPTDVEWLATLLRRVPAQRLCVVLVGAAGQLPAALSDPVGRYATTLTVDGPFEGPAPHDAGPNAVTLATQYIETECTSPDARLRVAYAAIEAPARARLHDERALVLERRGEESLALGAIPFHRERGADPRGAGADALLGALQRCMLNGYYDAVVDLAARCFALLDWDERAEDCWLVTAKIALALAALGKPDDAMALYDRACEQSALPRVHLRAAYGRAMLYSRYYGGNRRNHPKAKAWVNAAIAMASLLPDPSQRAFNLSFAENARALIEMHLGDAQQALSMITRSLATVDRDLADGEQVLHRSVLQYNRAQLLDRFGEPAHALVQYDKLIAADPHQSEYYLQRAAVHRRLGDVAAAVRDYTAATHYSPPYPEPYEQRADLLLAVGDEQSAVRDLRYVLELDPDRVEARIRLATTFLESGQLHEAGSQIEDGLTREDVPAELQVLRALLEHRRGDLRASHLAFDAAIALDPDLSTAWANRAILWFEEGEVQRAVDDLTRALDLGNDPDVLSNRAVAYEALGNADAARADRQLALAAVSGATG